MAALYYTHVDTIYIIIHTITNTVHLLVPVLYITVGVLKLVYFIFWKVESTILSPIAQNRKLLTGKQWRKTPLPLHRKQLLHDGRQNLSPFICFHFTFFWIKDVHSFCRQFLIVSQKIAFSRLDISIWENK